MRLASVFTDMEAAVEEAQFRAETERRSFHLHQLTEGRVLVTVRPSINSGSLMASFAPEPVVPGYPYQCIGGRVIDHSIPKGDKRRYKRTCGHRRNFDVHVGDMDPKDPSLVCVCGGTRWTFDKHRYNSRKVKR